MAGANFGWAIFFRIMAGLIFSTFWLGQFCWTGIMTGSFLAGLTAGPLIGPAKFFFALAGPILIDGQRRLPVDSILY